jgi:hypothetical protein
MESRAEKADCLPQQKQSIGETSKNDKTLDGTKLGNAQQGNGLYIYLLNDRV